MLEYIRITNPFLLARMTVVPPLHANRMPRHDRRSYPGISDKVLAKRPVLEARARICPLRCDKKAHLAPCFLSALNGMAFANRLTKSRWSTAQGGHRFFSPAQAKGSPASAMFSHGHYSLEARKGLAPGKYVVKIFANAAETSELSPEELMTGSQRNTNDSETPQQIIPAKYNTKSTQLIEVTAHGPNEFDFDIKSK